MFALPLVFSSPITWVVIGAAAMLLVWAMQPLIVRPVSELVGAMPLFGRDLKRAVEQAGAEVHRRVSDWAAEQLQGAVELLSVPIRAVFEFVDAVGDFVDTTTARLNEIARMASGEIGALGSRIATLGGRISAAAATAGAAAAAIPRLWSELARISSVVIPAAIALAAAGIMASVRFLVEREAMARGRAIDDQRVATGRAIDGEAGARAHGDATLAGAAAATTAELLRRLTDAEGRSRTYADQRVRPVDDALTHLRDIALPATLAAALAATNVLARDYANTRARCVDPICSAITPGLDFLNLLGSGALLLSVLGMVGAAVSDPQGAAADTAGGVGSLVAGAQGVLSPFVSAGP